MRAIADIAAASRDPGPLGGRVLAAACGLGAGAVVVLAGLQTAALAPTTAWAAGSFVGAAAAWDLHANRVPNLLTLPALAAAVTAAFILGTVDTGLASVLGAAIALAVLVPLYGLGVLGAGDVKTLMVVGALLGAPVALATAIAAILIGGVLGVAWVVAQGEMRSFLARWRRNLVTSISLRRPRYEPPPPGDAARRGIPFAVALALGLAVHLQWSFPW